jgi:hydroxymethylpyrimidine/phosphomethylpyrimidine kinase
MMKAPMRRIHCALAIGGLDPGGGAGIIADLRAFRAAGAFGCAAVAILTVQSTDGLERVRPVSPRDLRDQAHEVLAHQRVRAVKVGALGTEGNVRAVVELLRRHADLPVVVDTPMLPTRGRPRLLAPGAVRALREELVPRATLVTTNTDEAGALLGEAVRSVGEAHDAARELVRRGARAVLVKGGHLSGANAIDVLALADDVVELRARRLAVGAVHGTGCTLASLIAGRLAVGGGGTRVGRAELVGAIRWAKRVHHSALARAVDVGGRQRAMLA